MPRSRKEITDEELKILDSYLDNQTKKELRRLRKLTKNLPSSPQLEMLQDKINETRK